MVNMFNILMSGRRFELLEFVNGFSNIVVYRVYKLIPFQT